MSLIRLCRLKYSILNLSLKLWERKTFLYLWIYMGIQRRIIRLYMGMRTKWIKKREIFGKSDFYLKYWTKLLQCLLMIIEPSVINKSKSSTARAVIGKDIGILNWFTLESSFHAFRYFNMANRCYVLWKYTIDDYNAMGEYLCKGIYATIKSFFDNVDGIKYNIYTNMNNAELADNSITVNALARRAHNEILQSTELKKKFKTQRNGKLINLAIISYDLKSR